MVKVARFFRSILRTIVAGALVALALIGIVLLFLCRSWAHENYFRWLIIVPLGAISIILFFFGIYQISPIYWIWLKHRIDRTDWAEYVMETYELKRKYIW